MLSLLLLLLLLLLLIIIIMIISKAQILKKPSALYKNMIEAGQLMQMYTNQTNKTKH